jgi:hypothetical protein
LFYWLEIWASKTPNLDKLTENGIRLAETDQSKLCRIMEYPSESTAVKNDYPEVAGTFEKELRTKAKI